MARTKQTARPKPKPPGAGPCLIGVVQAAPAVVNHCYPSSSESEADDSDTVVLSRLRPRKKKVVKPVKPKVVKPKVVKPKKAPKQEASTIEVLPACFAEIHRLFPQPFLSPEWFKLIGVQQSAGIGGGLFKTEQECEHFRDYVAWMKYYASIVDPIPEASRVVNMPLKFAKVHKAFPAEFLSAEWFELINVQQISMLMGHKGVLKNSSRAVLFGEYLTWAKGYGKEHVSLC